MKLTKVAESIIAEDSGAPLRKHIAELEKDRDMLRLALDHSTEDYYIIVAGSRKLSSECDQLEIRCNNLQAKLEQAHSDAKKHISDLEAKVASTEARSVEIAAKGEKDLKDFQVVLVQQPEQVHDMYAGKV
jgi:SMC interacting uncharacterized protein involved in chromosome segregation